ncbi:alkaline phosphatase family protein [Rossellomorea aquimaris]|uniref:Type I phosphodiesterase/nucleotide pyrophosphatase n=1 Tax=Rossellomorea aquimaris TaxID=189382 RepID=A0A366EL05_9BACI|nr:alkaline phosphatase family protein [Rossellomorea aquimaris]RBP03014.1 type I phosphodiesterase/nucleotide pyrophosphatase [Rossellomorea aquimaris]
MSTNDKLIFIMIDGLRFDTAVDNMGYLHHLVEKGQASRFKVISEVPSMSRPLYEVLLTGTPPYQNGITSNQIVCSSKEESIFHLTSKNGLKNATASYHWVSELYHSAPFNPMTDRIKLDGNGAIQNGMFYWEDHYPDTHLFADANYMKTTKDPDFLYIHSMNVDDDGHKYTADSAGYRNRVIAVDVMLASILPDWIEEGYQIIISADHGMNKDGQHGGTTKEDREVPLFVISSKLEAGIYEQEVPQLQIAPLLCKLLNIQPSPAMQELTIPGLTEGL